MHRENALSTTLTPSALRVLLAYESIYGQKPVVCAALLAFAQLDRTQRENLIQQVNRETRKGRKK